jgi:hypothetical protein
MAYDYGNTPNKRKTSPAQGKHAKSGPRSRSTGRHAAESRALAVVAPETRVVRETRTTRNVNRNRRSTGWNLPRTDKRRRGPFSKSSDRSPVLIAEFLGGAALITITLFTRGGKQGYQSIMTDLMIRLSALTAIFFVLFLMSGSKRGSQAASAFGALIDLGILYAAAQKQDVSTFVNLITGKGDTSGTTLAADITEAPTEYHETDGLSLSQGQL